MAIANLLAPDRVKCGIEASSKKHALEILSELLANGSEAVTINEIFESLCAREKLGNTCMGNCAALPHGRIEALEASVGAFVTLAEPIDFGDVDGDFVDKLFAIAVAGNSEPEEHLENLAAAAELLNDINVRAQIDRAGNDGSLYRLLIERSPPIGRQASG